MAETDTMKKRNFYELIEQDRVVIPKLQRDYAFGRESEKEKCESFVKKILDSLKENKEKNLDFIYGKKNKGWIKLIDGQQRITNLFLIHWYLAVVENKYKNFKGFVREEENGKSKFSYNTRLSAERFVDKMVSLEDDGKAIEKELQNKKISTVIQNQKWFLYEWKKDPTVRGMLNTLDIIHKQYGEMVSDEKNSVNKSLDLYSRLEKDSLITFYFLDMGDKFKLTDELYIKMNSRGKTLTFFENLKSLLLPLYNERQIPNQQDYLKQKINAENETYRSYVAKNLDGIWTKIFWKRFQEKKEVEPNIDIEMVNFLYMLLVYEDILRYDINRQKKEEYTKELKNLMDHTIKNEDEISLSYEEVMELIEKNTGYIDNIVSYFKFFEDLETKGSAQEVEERKEREKRLDILVTAFSAVGKQYVEKVITFAYLYYGLKNGDANKRIAWFRFIRKIVNNSNPIDNTGSFIDAILGVKKICDVILENEKNEETLLDKLDELNDLPTLDTKQLKQEIFKKRVIMKDSSWEEIFTNAENALSYFEGNIILPLLIASIKLDEVNPDATTDGAESDREKKKKFNNIVNVMKDIFDISDGKNIVLENKEVMVKVRRYLLMTAKKYEDCFINISANFSLMSDDSDRDVSWKRYVREYYFFEDGKGKVPENGDLEKPIVNLIKLLSNLDGAKIEDISKKIVEEIQEIQENQANKPLWLDLLSDNMKILFGERFSNSDNDKFIFEFSPQKYIRIKNPDGEGDQIKKTDEIDEKDKIVYIISKVRITSGHAEIHSLAKHFELETSLKEETIGITITYKPTHNEGVEPYILIESGSKKCAIWFAGQMFKWTEVTGDNDPDQSNGNDRALEYDKFNIQYIKQEILKMKEE